ncbi:MAG: ABC transporter ATP-binding protein, partial [Gemmatimonadota bacterium]
YMEEAEYCDRLALMNRGRLIALDTPAALREGSREVIYRLVSPEAVRLAEALSGRPGILEAALFGRDVHVSLADAADEADLRVTLQATGIPVDDVARVQPALEDVFVARVRAAGGAAVG